MRWNMLFDGYNARLTESNSNPSQFVIPLPFSILRSGLSHNEALLPLAPPGSPDRALDDPR